MGLQMGIGTAQTIAGHTKNAGVMKDHGRVLTSGIEDRNGAVNVVSSLLSRAVSDSSGFMNTLRTSESYLSVAKATLNNVKKELTEMKQLANTAQSGSATDLAKMQAIFASKQEFSSAIVSRC